MFNFLSMAGNYESRKVDCTAYDWGFISTAAVSDGRQPYETAVKHDRYNDGSMVIVEGYDTKTAAAAGHAKWVAKMTAPELPKQLKDCCNSGVGQMYAAVGGGTVHKLQKARS